MATTKTQLAAAFKNALDHDSEKSIEDIGTPAQARERLANALADAVEAYVVTRQVTVGGVQVGGGTATGVIN